MKMETDGQAAELIAMTEAIYKGFRVSLPFGGKAPYDFIMESNGSCFRIQVKQIYLGKISSGTRWMVDFMKPRGGARNLKYEKYSKKDCDMLVAVCPYHKAIYLFPVEVTQYKRQASFYFDSKPSSMARNTEWVEQYRDVWPL